MRYEVSASWSIPIALWVAELRAAGRPETTIRLRRDHVRQYARHCRRDPWDVTGDDLVDWAARHQWAQDTRRSWRSSMRTFYAWAQRRGYIEDSPADALPSVAQSAPNPRPVPEPAYRDAIAAAPPRTRLMLRLAGDHGLRRAEVAQIQRRDVFADEDGWSLIVHGKGDKVRVVPLTDDVAAELRKHGPGYIFPGQHDGHVSAAWVGTLVSRHLPEGYTTHKLRHRAASRWYSIDRDYPAIADLLGHASLETTRRYVRRPQDAARRLVLAGAA